VHTPGFFSVQQPYWWKDLANLRSFLAFAVSTSDQTSNIDLEKVYSIKEKQLLALGGMQMAQLAFSLPTLTSALQAKRL